MLRTPPEETIASITSNLLMCLPRYRERNYAGSAPGKRRKLEVCDDIAREIAPRYLFPVAVTDNGRAVSADELADELAKVLRSIPAEQAYHMVSPDFYEKRDLVREIARRMAAQMVGRYQMEQIDNTAAMLRVSVVGGPSLDSLIAAKRRGEESGLRYTWRRTDKANYLHYTGLDGDMPFAYVGADAGWGWQCIVDAPRTLNSLPHGRAETDRQAACDAEDYYDALKCHRELIAGK